MTPKELPYHLKDFHYVRIYAFPKLSKMTTEMPENVKVLRAQFESAWNHLKNAMALIYDEVYTEEELDMAAMKATVKSLHNQLTKEGWEITDLKK